MSINYDNMNPALISLMHQTEQGAIKKERLDMLIGMLKVREAHSINNLGITYQLDYIMTVCKSDEEAIRFLNGCLNATDDSLDDTLLDDIFGKEI
jgi:hypothetical protein